MDCQILQSRSELLPRMSTDDLARLRPHLASVLLELRAPLENTGQKIDAVYFLESGLASVVARTSEATEAEVGIIGFAGAASRLSVGANRGFSATEPPGGHFEWPTR
ncbi:hypothetical protein [Mesorhizobium sp. CO1-1-8]|uniref:hypothetical protein n=1 Tax=Mesorhizobium sp. CO1-1-8 TaxID=2876631 RepID=UPI001CD0CE4C|nr:hypothetical protein [Mesorhizobium sp. CO1-1-8]MBZ9776098.1 hypothetical protein [Mesorhizobium sp. CO1-1-8]